MHFTISNSHIFNCSGTRLYPQGHSTNNFSSLTIQIVAYLLNKYWGLPPLPGISPNRPRASARAYLIHHEFFVACTVAQGPWAGVFRKGGRPGERAPSNSSHHCYLFTSFCINCIGKGTLCVHACSYCKGIIPEKSFEGRKWSVFISSTCFKC